MDDAKGGVGVLVKEAFRCAGVSPEVMDMLWATGFRHFGELFFKYDTCFHADRNCRVLPLRINLNRFKPSRSQRRIIKKNSAFKVVFRDAFIDAEKEKMFQIHKKRFTENVPDSLFDFFSPDPSRIPCRTLECCLFSGDRLAAVGFMDEGRISTSSVYTIFDTEFEKTSPGIFVLLMQISYSIDAGKRYLYHGYAFRESSFYDYKKRFSGLEYYDWQGGWKQFAPPF